MPDWILATKATIRFTTAATSATTSGVGNLLALDAAIDLVRALAVVDSATEEIVERLDRLERRDFPEGMRLLENAGLAETAEFRRECLVGATRSFNQALSTVDDGVETANIRYHNALAHLLLGERRIARRNLEAAATVCQQLDEFDTVLQTERALGSELGAIRADYVGRRGTGPVARMRTLVWTSVSYRYVVYPLRAARFRWRTRHERRYLASDPAREAKAFFAVAETGADVTTDVRELARAVDEARRAIG